MHKTERSPENLPDTTGPAGFESLMRGATLRQLRAFTLVAQHHSFMKAAAHLHLSPSAVSLQIRELEHASGMALFDRQARTVSLTSRSTLAKPRTSPLVS